jgi:uncharacterized protein (TIGR04255 family)
MSTTLKYSPIKEIIFKISFAEQLDKHAVDSFFDNNASAKKFTSKVRLDTQIEDQHKDTQESKSTSFQYVFNCIEQKKIIQIKQGSFSLHKTGEYEHFDSLLEELRVIWTEFVQFAGLLTILNISVRYLNFIEKTDSEAISELITIGVNHPFNALNNHFIQLQFNYSPSILVNLITTTSIDKKSNESGVILDIALHQKIDDIRNFEEALVHFNEMRAAKNYIFFNSITQHTVRKYNQ